MTTFSRLALIPVVAAGLLLAACGDDASTTGPAPTSTTATTAALDIGAGAEQPASGDVADITVKVGVDDSPDRVETVRLGQTVVITLQSDEDEVYHLHGYDIEQRAAAGTEAEITFTADKPGRFELESHTTDKVLLVLDVS